MTCHQFTGTVQVNGGVGISGRPRGHAGTIVFNAATRADFALSDTLRLGSDRQYTFGNLTILSGGKLELDCDVYDNEVEGVFLGSGTIVHASNINVHAGGFISADSLGFDCRQGPGGMYASYGGGTLGGKGGGNASATYGSPSAPICPGSGGYGTEGGGALKLNVPDGEVIVNGTITAGTSSSDKGSGSGGSIWIVADTLSGAGTIRANGGGTRGGGGGRISLLDVGNHLFSGSVQVNGGAGSNGRPRGHAGTIVFNAATMANFSLSNTLRLGSDMEYTFGDLTILSGGRLELDGDVYTNEVNGVYHGLGGVVHASNVNVHVGGTISADGLGFDRRQGPGKGTAVYDGGTFGGHGCYNTNSTYGSPSAPISLGSGGYGDIGAGALKLNVPNGEVTINGTITANAPTTDWGSGSGGSIWIVADIVSGTGKISASGGLIRGGGGGRVAVYGDYTGFNTSNAFAAAGSALAGDGTILFSSDGDTMSDQWEQQVVDADPGDSITSIEDVLPSGDFDNDGHSNSNEFLIGAAPTGSDSDGDGMEDGWEFINGLDPISSEDASLDSDSDGMTNAQEFERGHDPVVPDVGPISIYVDAAAGDDTNYGIAPDGIGLHGPVQSIGRAADLSLDGDTLSISQGTYPEFPFVYDFEDGTVTIQFNGTVVIE